MAAEDLDPIQAAALAGGRKQVARLVLFRLVRKGWVTIEQGLPVLARGAPSRSEDPFEQIVLRELNFRQGEPGPDVYGFVNLMNDLLGRLERGLRLGGYTRPLYETVIVVAAMHGTIFIGLFYLAAGALASRSGDDSLAMFLAIGGVAWVLTGLIAWIGPIRPPRTRKLLAKLLAGPEAENDPDLDFALRGALAAPEFADLK